jgi:hypothetical protein
MEQNFFFSLPEVRGGDIQLPVIFNFKLDY